MPDWILPTDISGKFHGEGLIPIDAAHRQGVPHRGVWLHVLLQAAEPQVLIVRRSARMVTCPESFSIIGEHHNGREEDDQAAKRAVNEELPGLAPLAAAGRLRIAPLRPTPRWFLFDYPPARDDVKRYECARAAAAHF